VEHKKPKIMKSETTVIAEISELNKHYTSDSNTLTHDSYLRKYKKIANQLKPMSFAETIRKEGIKVSRSKTHYREYTYKGKNFTVNFCQASCETTWWEASVWEDNVDPRVHEHFDGYNHWYSKAEVVVALYDFDMYLNTK
jgi:hypothetical protein